MTPQATAPLATASPATVPLESGPLAIVPPAIAPLPPCFQASRPPGLWLLRPWLYRPLGLLLETMTASPYLYDNAIAAFCPAWEGELSSLLGTPSLFDWTGGVHARRSGARNSSERARTPNYSA